MPCSACGSHRRNSAASQKRKFEPLQKKKAAPPPTPPPTPTPTPPVVVKKKVAPPRKVFRPINVAQYKLYQERMKIIEAEKKKKRYARRFKRMQFSTR